jgi:hypothetical protein
MVMAIDSQMFSPGADIYYDPAFRDTLEANMAHLRNSDKTTARSVDSHRATVYEGDLFGYLLELGIAPHLHFVTMRVNKFFSPYEFGVHVTQLRIPDNQEIDVIRQSQKSGGSVSV